ncbi:MULTISPECIES: hydroxymethylbilane synthase [unclassified Sphingomonas]|uniref:hydroxymethylbilane synthase n=1 Tax=unclassified Sphingomonas TaxID=196159 RepID=UPI002151F21D|nr:MULTISPECIES: hydroxymethylbilane synthase [unclassified Sphingomonas]MCR5870457.1 hydroxymethylbilane synthase [Sphingomonas sp. J344]UUY01198.1 hydroxymethylbilane synthase [Sphingomonas sp. J315]
MLLRLGTRASPLALIQANMVRDALLAAHGWSPDAIEIVPIRTTGDRVQDRPLAEIGGKALWTKELDRALLDRAIDLAVHSMKDVETIRPDTIAVAAMLPRADVRDRLIGAASIDALPHGARIGTSSPRRAAQLRRLRPDLAIVPLRGNVDTRRAKVAAGEADATLLAAAGLERLGYADIGVAIDVDLLLPAPSQGAVGIEVRAEDAATRSQVAAIGDAATERCVWAERALLAALGGDCHSPIAALATLEEDGLRLRAEILNADGSEHVGVERRSLHGTAQEAVALAQALLGRASPQLRRMFGH